MLLRIACCDDETQNKEIIEKYVRQLEIQVDEEFVFDFYVSGAVLLEKMEREKDFYDVIFLDMEMPEINGIELAKKIRNIASKDVIISFLTSYPQYMQQSFGVQAFQYLLKPLSYEEFKTEILRTIDFIKKDDQSLLFVNKDNGEEVVIRLKNIITIEKMKGSAVMEITKERDIVYARGNLSDYEQILRDNHFIRVSRNCMVNMQYIHSFYEREIKMITGKRVEMSRRKVTEIKEIFTKYLVLGGKA